jgi:hypothetical protein
MHFWLFPVYFVILKKKTFSSLDPYQKDCTCYQFLDVKKRVFMSWMF